MTNKEDRSMGRMRIRAVTTVLGAALLALTGSAGAQVIPPTAKCEGGKLKCATTFWTGLLGCSSKDSGKPDAVALAACELKSQTKYDGGVLTPEKGCFAKLEAKPPCLTDGDSGLVDSLITSSQGPVVQATLNLDPAFPPSTLSKCTAGKKKCVTNLVKGLLGCFSNTARRPHTI